MVANSPAARAGLKAVRPDRRDRRADVDDPNAFDYRFATRPLGGTSQIDVQRAGKPVKLTVPLETAPDTGRNEIVLTSALAVPGREGRQHLARGGR